MNKTLFHLLALCLLGLSVMTIPACDSDDDDGPDNEEELITTVTLTFASGANIVTATWQDLDGPGGNAPDITPLTLAANTVYTLAPTFRNDAANPPKDITTEIAEEGIEHLICWTATGDIAAPIVQDLDDRDEPLGLVNSFTTGAAGTGTLTLRLKHEPEKSAEEPCNTGETDVEVTFNVTIQ